MKPGGVKIVMAETIATRQQLIVINRGRKRAPRLTTFDRFFFGFIAFFVKGKRLDRISVILKASTILKFHKALVKRKYQELYSNKGKKTPGRKGPDQELINLVIEMKKRNPRVGYGRISIQIYHEFGIIISRFTVGRILRNHFKYYSPNSGEGPSWLTFIGHMKDSLWSVDLFKCESIFLKSHWVMVVLDQFSRRIIGFSVVWEYPFLLVDYTYDTVSCMQIDSGIILHGGFPFFVGVNDLGFRKIIIPLRRPPLIIIRKVESPGDGFSCTLS